MFLVSSEISIPLIIGMDELLKNTTRIDLSNGVIFIAGTRLPVVTSPFMTVTALTHSAALATPPNVDVSDLIDPDCPDRERLVAFLQRNINVFAEDPLNPGIANLPSDLDFHINTGDHAPVISRPYRAPLAKRKLIEEHISNLLRANLIQPSRSDWASPVLLVPKKDGTTRFCVDFRRVNKLTVPDSFPLPRVDDTLDSLAGSAIFAKLDLAQGFHQIPLAADARPKTAFVTHAGLFEYRVLPFGLRNAPTTFQFIMESVLRGVPNLVVYIDDITVYGKNTAELIAALEAVFQRLRTANLHLKRSKCLFGAKSIQFLGHLVSAEGVAPDPALVSHIQRCRAPTSVSEVQSFNGLANYYRRYIKGFSHLIEPLVALTRKDTPFEWGERQQQAFDELKKKLTNPPVLAYPNPSKKYTLYTDASDIAIGSVLSQSNRVIGYHSAKLPRARRYTTDTYARELYAIFNSVMHFRHYLDGVEFEVVTDHKPLVTFMTSTSPTPHRIYDTWRQKLSQFNFEIKWREGSSHSNADALSRTPACGTVRGPTILQEQKQTPWCRSLVRWIKERVNPDDPYSRRLVKLHGTQFRILSDGTLGHVLERIGAPDLTRQIVPAMERRLQIIRQYHADAFGGGHLGRLKTFSKLRQHYWWPTYRRDVTNYIRSCEACQRVKASSAKRPGLLKPISVSEPWEILCTDIVGPFPVTPDGHRYILCVTDYLTSWVEAFPIRDITASTIANKLVRSVFTRYGAPRYLLSDQGSQFTSELLHLVCNVWNIKRIRTSPFHPQTNGKVEKFNSTLCDMLSSYVNDDRDDWNKYLPLVLYSYRTSDNPSTGFTPFFLNFGRDPPPLNDEPTVTSSNTDVDNYVNQLRSRLQIARTIARERFKRSQRAHKNYYDKRKIHTTFEIGDWVLIEPDVPNQRRKLEHRWFGPFRITKKIADTTYEVQNESTAETKTIHVSKIKQYFSPFDHDIEDSKMAPENPEAVGEPPASTVQRRPATSALQDSLVDIYQTVIGRPNIRIKPVKDQLNNLRTTG